MGKSRVYGLLSFAIMFFLLLTACSINVKKEKNGQDKQVDINTPVGGIHVSKGVNPEDIGLPIYPGARLRQRNSGDDKGANVNISGFGYGLKVVAQEYESDETPSRIVAYYKEHLQKFGNVIVCHTSGLNVNAGMKKADENSRELTCEGQNGADIELKVGTQENQHIVAVEPRGSGSNFSLVYVRTHNKDAEI